MTTEGPTTVEGTTGTTESLETRETTETLETRTADLEGPTGSESVPRRPLLPFVRAD